MKIQNSKLVALVYTIKGQRDCPCVILIKNREEDLYRIHDLASRYINKRFKKSDAVRLLVNQWNTDLITGK